MILVRPVVRMDDCTRTFDRKRVWCIKNEDRCDRERQSESFYQMQQTNGVSIPTPIYLCHTWQNVFFFKFRIDIVQSSIWSSNARKWGRIYGLYLKYNNSKATTKRKTRRKPGYFVKHVSHPRPSNLQSWGDTQLNMPGSAFTKVLTPQGGRYAFDMTLSVKKLWK